MHAAGELRGSQGPALLQHEVVDILEPQPGDFAEHVERIEPLLQVYHADLAGAPLPLHHLPQRVGRGAVAAAGIEEDEINGFSHWV